MRSTKAMPPRIIVDAVCCCVVGICLLVVVNGFVSSTTNRQRWYHTFDNNCLQQRNDNCQLSISNDDNNNDQYQLDRQNNNNNIVDNNNNNCNYNSIETTVEKNDNNKRRSLLKGIVQVTTSLGIMTTGISDFPSTALAATATRSAATTSQFLIPNPVFTNDVSWPLGKVAFSLLPLAGTSTPRATIEEEIVPDTIFTHDQIQGVINVNVPVRQTVIVLESGGLLVYNPIAPTQQLLSMMKRLIQKYGPVKHLVLGTVAIEHKATFGPFASYYPQATCWVQPGQYSVPFNFPIEFLGVQQRGSRLREIPVPGQLASKTIYQTFAVKDGPPEWLSEIDYEVLGPFTFQTVGAYSETVLFHKKTKTLLVTDIVCSVTATPPPIIQEDPRALLYHARDTVLDNVTDTIENRQRGWRRMVQFGLIFLPSQITVDDVDVGFAEAKQVPANLKNLGTGAIPFGGTIYPWKWNPNDADLVNFNAISQQGTLFCPPILTKLIFDREVQGTLDFVTKVTTRFANMERIIPCHLNNNIVRNTNKNKRMKISGTNINDATIVATEFYNAFDPLRSTIQKPIPQRALIKDLELLQNASIALTQFGVIPPSQICDGTVASSSSPYCIV